MKPTVNNLLLTGAVLAAVLTCVAPAEAAPGDSVVSGRVRMKSLATAQTMMDRKMPSWKTLNAGLIKDPFFRTTETVAVVSEGPVLVPASARSSRDVLKAVAPQIVATGTMFIGAEPYLLMGGRRYRIGDKISVIFEETIHSVQIASIERNYYTLRLKDSELRRDLK